MAEYYVDLRAGIDTDPVNDPPASDDTVHSWLNENVTVPFSVNYQDLVVWSSEEGVARKLKAAIADEEVTPGTWTNPVYNDVLTLDLLLKSGGDVDLSRSDVRGIVNSISGAGLPLTPANRDALFAKSDAPVVRWTTFVGASPAVSDVNVARAL